MNIFICFGVPQVEWIMNYIKYTKLREYIKLFWEIESGSFCKQPFYQEEISEKTTITGSGSDDSENSYQQKRSSR